MNPCMLLGSKGAHTVTGEEIRAKALAYTENMIRFALSDGIVTDVDGQKVGPGMPMVNPATGETFVVDPVKSKLRRTEWAKGCIMLCKSMGWLTDEEERKLFRRLPPFTA